MALRLSNREIYTPVCKAIIKQFKYPKVFYKPLHNSPNLNTVSTTDTLDDFTTQLLQKKSEKWEKIRSKKNLRINPCQNQETNLKTTINILNFTKNEIDVLLKDAVDVYNCSDTLDIVNQCIKYNKYPSTELILRVLSIFARNGDKEIILKLHKFVELNDPVALKIHADFKHFLGIALWMKGNVEESLNLLDNVYRNHNILRRRIKLIFKYLVMDITYSRSEAILVLIIKHFMKIYNDFGDYYPLACVWQECFLSKWYSDQQIALNLLKEHNNLCKMVINRIPYVVTSALRNHQVDSVYRLLEILLEYDMKSEYSRVLGALFDYKCLQCDVRSCSEIMQWSLQYDIFLSPTQYNNFLALLLCNNIEMKEGIHKKPIVPTIKLKF